MKRIVLAGIAAAGLAVTSHAQSFPSVNKVAFVPVTIPANGGLVMCALNVSKMGGDGTITLSRLFGTNQLIKANFASQATAIYVWNGATYTTSYQKPSGQMMNDVTLAPGQAFWIKSVSTQPTNHTVYLAGEVNTAGQVQRPHSPGLAMMGSPYGGSWDLNALETVNWTNAGAKAANFASQADSIYLWTGSTYTTYFLKPDNQWHYGVGGAIVTNPIPAGTAFWYLTRQGFTCAINGP